MDYLVICSVAFLASGLTLLSGFGLGTLLLPAFAAFFPVERAVALTGVVHFLNGLFKLALLFRHVAWRVVLVFGIPAFLSALAGAWVLMTLAEADPLWTYRAFGRMWAVTPVKFVVGLLLLFFAAAEALPALRSVTFPPAFLPAGGALSGFFGGLAGMQGALRSAFLVKTGLAGKTYVATSAAIAFLIDVSRLGVYARLMARDDGAVDHALLAAAVVSAFAGAALGNRYLAKVTVGAVRRLVAVLLFLASAGLISGML